MNLRERRGVVAPIAFVVAIFIILLFMVATIINSDGNYSSLSVLNGGTIMSIDNAKYLTGNNESSEVYIIDAVLNGGGQSISGTIEPQDVERYGVEKVPEQFNIDYQLLEASCDYRIQYTNKSIYKVYQSTAVDRNIARDPPYNQVSLQTTKNWCSNGAPSLLPKSSPGNGPEGGACSEIQEFGEWGYWSPEQSNRGNQNGLGDWRATNVGGIPFYDVHYFETRPQLNYKAKIIVTNSNGDVVETILDSKTQTANLGKYGNVQIVGNLVANELCPVPAVDYAVVENEDGKKIVEKSFIQTWLTNYRNLDGFDNDYFEFQWRERRIDPGVGADWIFGSISGMNNMLTQIDEQDLDIGCDVNGSTLSCEPETQVIYPNLRLSLATNYLGVSKDRTGEIDEKISNVFIKLPVNGIPKIQEVEYEEIYAQEISKVSIKVDNIGNQTGSFDVDLRCDPNDIAFASRRISLDPNSGGTVELLVNGDTGEYDCEVTATNFNVPDNKDSKEVSIDILERSVPDSPEDLKENMPDDGEKEIWEVILKWSLIIIGALAALAGVFFGIPPATILGLLLLVVGAIL